MKRENEGLRSMVTQVTEKYLFLQRHIQENIVTRDTKENIKVIRLLIYLLSLVLHRIKSYIHNGSINFNNR